MDEKPIRLTVASILGARSKQGMVELTINGVITRMELPKAREVVVMLQGAIEAAVSDELMFTFLTTKIGLPEGAAATALLELRKLRQGSYDTVFPQ